jgi:hypothetical protein
MRHGGNIVRADNPSIHDERRQASACFSQSRPTVCVIRATKILILGGYGTFGGRLVRGFTAAMVAGTIFDPRRTLGLMP